ncbi:helix-turn-helix domain-containing protein [Aeromicrobium sp. UC242_57]|uniref:helix-turn-helix domain-containing protein n=1 Tax=Aeromicrobium sp. UC242_57 TaxID=3374624 RepID=UPI00378C4DD7
MPADSSREPSASAFAAVLRRQRESAGLTQAELAARAGIGVRTVSNLERSINVSPYPSTVRLLADALDLAQDARRDLLAASGRRPVADKDGTPVTGGYLGGEAVDSTHCPRRGVWGHHGCPERCGFGDGGGHAPSRGNLESARPDLPRRPVSTLRIGAS